MCGGRGSGTKKKYTDIFGSVDAGSTWNKLEKMKESCGKVGMAAYKGSILAVGGEGEAKVLSTFAAYDVKKDSWKLLPSL